MIFLDASLLLAVLLDTEKADQCEAILSGIEVGQIKAVTTSHVLEEAAFKLTFAKASEILQTKDAWKIREELKTDGPLRKECHKTLGAFINYVEALCLGGLRVVEVQEEDIYNVPSIFEETGLLTADCFHLAVIRRLNIKGIATLDEDFRKVKELNVLP